MKDYLFLLRGGIPMANKTEAQQKSELQSWNSYMGELQKKGKLVGGLPLVGGGKTVSAKKTSNEAVTSASEGIIGGYLIVKADSLDEAAKIANTCPHISNEGNIEVREIGVMPTV
jgi:hypothetical protein